ncbi:hemin-degrading factor [Polymorphum gilvum]|uniref:Hemin degrading factor n=1 Tax=Polymorphum gilvum (strain LMG 25793 / CGMCC 1.9160 / SL003B-26A1) TaxID=991905 RepID=F2IZW6_POLGS|nr:hemin-degrading factor [Polymorphum gilvum]ADZ70692.1 Hemin degrading factor [Polymorphum gilvum SL003B-26A1]
MTADSRPTPNAIRRARADHPERRERDLARDLGISEAELVAAFCGKGVTRVTPSMSAICSAMAPVGEVMILTRNDSAVHEKIGVFEKFVDGSRAGLMLGANIDTRMFPGEWVHGFAVEKQTEHGPRRSLQIFDRHGDAVFKIHLRPASNLDAWNALIGSLTVEDQTAGLVEAPKPAERTARQPLDPSKQAPLRERWGAMNDPHQFFGILRDLDLPRLNALELAGDDYAWRLDGDAVLAMMRHAAAEQIPIMCFVGNRGCIQIHSGPIAALKEMGPWMNVLDPTFHLHLRMDHIKDVWAVRKGADKGHVTSVEAFDGDGNHIIQFFGVRGEGNHERADWRSLVEKLPRMTELQAV